MEEKPFRVLLDFTELNLDQSLAKYVWMNVCPRELRTVDDLKHAILKKFPFIQENVKLFLLDGLLPENERIFILRENDTVKLQVETSNQSFMEFRQSYNNLESSNHNDYQKDSSHCLERSKESKKRKSDTYLTTYLDKSLENPSKKKKGNSKNFFEPILIDISSSVAIEEEEFRAQLASQNIQEPCEDETDVSYNIENSSKKKKKDKSTKISKCYEPGLVNVSSSACLEDEQIQVHTSQNFDMARESESKVSHSSGKKRKNKSRSTVSRMSTCDFLTYAALSGLENNESTDNSNVNVCNNGSFSCTESNDRSSKVTFNENASEQIIEFKKKRKRKRKRKTVLEPSLADSIQTSVDADNFENSASSVNNNHLSETRKHVIYHSPTPPATSESSILASYPYSASVTPPKENNVVDNLNSISLDNKSLKNICSNKEAYTPVSLLNETGASPKVSTPYSKKMMKTKSWDITPMPKTSSTDSDTFSVKKLDSFNKEKIIKTDFDLCPPLNSLPPVGTHLAYKTLELSDNYCPEVTEFKEGIIKSIDPETDELEIELIEEEIKPGRIGKFELLKEDEIPPLQVIKKVHLKWKDLINPRLIN